MITYKKATIEHSIVDKVICDVCKVEFDNTLGRTETQEFLHINREGGYGAIMGDGVRWEADICQLCVNNLLGQYMRKVE